MLGVAADVKRRLEGEMNAKRAADEFWDLVRRIDLYFAERTCIHCP